MLLQRFLFLTFATACSGTMGWAPNAIGAETGLNFDSPGVLNLSLRPSHRVGKKLALDPLAPSEAAEILAARKMEADPDLLDNVMQKFDCGKQGEDCEAKRIAASGGAVQRRGGRLEISSEAGPPLWFGDVDTRTPNQPDRDVFQFAYWGRLQGSGYHRVQEEFTQDSPGSFLINARSGKVAFVHQYDDVVAVAPGGAHLVTVNYLNLPFAVRVAALDAKGPREVLICAAQSQDRDSLATVKGWHDGNTLDLVIETGTADARKKTSLRATFKDGAWRIATNDAAVLTAAGIECVG